MNVQQVSPEMAGFETGVPFGPLCLVTQQEALRHLLGHEPAVKLSDWMRTWVMRHTLESLRGSRILSKMRVICWMKYMGLFRASSLRTRTPAYRLCSVLSVEDNNSMESGTSCSMKRSPKTWSPIFAIFPSDLDAATMTLRSEFGRRVVR